MERYIVHDSPPRGWTQVDWRWPGYTPFSPGDGTYQVTDTGVKRFVDMAKGNALFVDFERHGVSTEQFEHENEDAVQRIVKYEPKLRGRIFVNALNPSTEEEARRLLPTYRAAGVVTVGYYISDSPDRNNEGVHLGSSFDRDTDVARRRMVLWKKICSLPIVFQIMDHYTVPDVSIGGQWMGTAKPYNNEDVLKMCRFVRQNTRRRHDGVLYWTPRLYDMRIIRAIGLSGRHG